MGGNGKVKGKKAKKSSCPPCKRLKKSRKKTVKKVAKKETKKTKHKINKLARRAMKFAKVKSAIGAAAHFQCGARFLKCRVIPSLTSRMKPKKHSPRSHGRHGGGISMKGIWGGSNRGGDIGEGRRPPSKKKCSCPTGMVPFTGGNRAGNDEELSLLKVGETSGCPP